MDSDHKSVLIFAGIFATTLITIVAICLMHNFGQSKLIAEMTEKGADPLKARCAIDHSVECMVLYGK